MLCGSQGFPDEGEGWESGKQGKAPHQGKTGIVEGVAEAGRPHGVIGEASSQRKVDSAPGPVGPEGGTGPSNEVSTPNASPIPVNHRGTPVVFGTKEQPSRSFTPGSSPGSFGSWMHPEKDGEPTYRIKQPEVGGPWRRKSST
ncbi:cuticle collagen 2C-like [Palaemon carinicauda]|uniref:cuticle collagen 2C-like n=1 Tax=Palaemon carinicauda TaxID=392227 RepID=UPI0035B68B5D